MGMRMIRRDRRQMKTEALEKKKLEDYSQIEVKNVYQEKRDKGL